MNYEGDCSAIKIITEVPRLRPPPPRPDSGVKFHQCHRFLSRCLAREERMHSRRASDAQASHIRVINGPLERMYVSKERKALP